MSFWHTFGIHTVSAVETILEKDVFTLEELLDEDEVLQETRAENQKLLDFLVQRPTLEKLFEYITVEVGDDADNVRKFKYPFISCELLCCDNWAIAEAVFEGEPLISKLYEFLERPPPVNASLASHVSKVASTLLEKKVDETMQYLRTRGDTVGTFLGHIRSPAIMDLLLKIISCDSESVKTADFLSQQLLIPRLVDMLEPGASEQEQTEAAARALVDIVQASSSSGATNALMAVLESDEVVGKLLAHMFSDAPGAEASLYHGLDVIGELLRRNLRPTLDSATLLEDAPAPIRAILSHLDSFHSILDKKRPVYKNSCGEIEPLGFMRLKVITFCVPLFSTNYKCVNAVLAENPLLDAVLESLFRFEWNNFLHREVESLIRSLLSSDAEMAVALVTRFRLAERLAQSDAASEQRFSASQIGFRRGNTGYVVLLSTALLERAGTLPALREALDASPGWPEFVAGSLAQQKEWEGYNRSDSMFDTDSDDDSNPDHWSAQFGDSESSSAEEDDNKTSASSATGGGDPFQFGSTPLWQDSSEGSEYEDVSFEGVDSDEELSDDDSSSSSPRGRPVSSISELYLPAHKQEQHDDEEDAQLDMADAAVGGTLPPLATINPEEQQQQQQQQQQEEKRAGEDEEEAPPGLSRTDTPALISRDDSERGAGILHREAAPDGAPLRATPALPSPGAAALLRAQETGNNYGTPPVKKKSPRGNKEEGEQEEDK